jgi:hypothetical protein
MTAHGSRPSIPPCRGVPCESGFHAVEAHLKSDVLEKLLSSDVTSRHCIEKRPTVHRPSNSDEQRRDKRL